MLLFNFIKRLLICTFNCDTKYQFFTENCFMNKFFVLCKENFFFFFFEKFSSKILQNFHHSICILCSPFVTKKYFKKTIMCCHLMIYSLNFLLNTIDNLNYSVLLYLHFDVDNNIKFTDAYRVDNNYSVLLYLLFDVDNNIIFTDTYRVDINLV